MKVALRKMGNSQGVIIPKALIAQCGFAGAVDLKITPEGILLTRPKEPARAGWAAASQALMATGDGELAWPEFGNEGDQELAW